MLVFYLFILQKQNNLKQYWQFFVSTSQTVYNVFMLVFSCPISQLPIFFYRSPCLVPCTGIASLFFCFLFHFSFLVACLLFHFLFVSCSTSCSYNVAFHVSLIFSFFVPFLALSCRLSCPLSFHHSSSCPDFSSTFLSLYSYKFKMFIGHFNFYAYKFKFMVFENDTELNDIFTYYFTKIAIQCF